MKDFYIYTPTKKDRLAVLAKFILMGIDYKKYSITFTDFPTATYITFSFLSDTEYRIGYWPAGTDFEKNETAIKISDLLECETLEDVQNLLNNDDIKNFYIKTPTTKDKLAVLARLQNLGLTLFDSPVSIFNYYNEPLSIIDSIYFEQMVGLCYYNGYIDVLIDDNGRDLSKFTEVKIDNFLECKDIDSVSNIINNARG